MSFRKRPSTSTSSTAHPPLPPHLRNLSPATSPTTSTGLQSLDTLLCGGLPLGSLTLFIEDYPTAFHVPFLQYISAQGIQSNHAVAVVAFHTAAERFVHSLPACVGMGVEGEGSRQGKRGMVDMQIAWRYQKQVEGGGVNLVKGNERGSGAFSFDLSKTMELPKGAAVSCLGRGVSESVEEVLEQIRGHLEKGFKMGMVSRVVVHGICGEVVEGGNAKMERFLCRLRGMMRIFGGVAVVACGRDVGERVCLVAGDAVVKVESFGGKGGGVAGLGKEWLGVLVVKKGFGEGRGGGRGRGDVWVFKRGRRKFIMERATAAPDEEDEVVGEKEKGIGGLCGVGTSSKMEF